MRPGTYIDEKLPKKSLPTKGAPDKAAARMLDEWRTSVYRRGHINSLLGRCAILDNTLLLDLVSYGPIDAAASTRLLEARWTLWPLYGEELVTHLDSVPRVYTSLRKKPSTPATKSASQVPADLRPLLKAAQESETGPESVCITLEPTGWTAVGSLHNDAVPPHAITGFVQHVFDRTGKETLVE